MKLVVGLGNPGRKYEDPTSVKTTKALGLSADDPAAPPTVVRWGGLLLPAAHDGRETCHHRGKRQQIHRSDHQSKTERENR